MQESVRETMRKSRWRADPRPEERRRYRPPHRQYDLGRARSPDDSAVDGMPDPQLISTRRVKMRPMTAWRRNGKPSSWRHRRDKGYYQAAFHARLAVKLSNLATALKRMETASGCGYRPRHTLKFSRRSAVIEAERKSAALRMRREKPARPEDAREQKQRPRQHGELRREWDVA